MRIRPAAASDLPGIARVAYATGFFGESAERFFPDRQLFADLWVRPYLRAGVGSCSFVAETDGDISGYVLAAEDPASYRRKLGQAVLQALRRIVQGRYDSLASSLRYLLRLPFHPARAAPAERYPAHLHINLLSSGRGQGLGRKLLRNCLDCLQAQGVAGVQLSTTVENRAALGLYESFGFRVAEEYRSSLWRPWLGRDTTHLTLARDLAGETAPPG